MTILSGLAVSSDTRQPTPDNLPNKYILFVSTIEPRKNLEVLLDAFARLRARGAYDGALVVVGRIGWKSDSIIPRLRAPAVHHLDYVPPPQLASIYRNAELFVFPSIYEGFGFPVAQAMACGVPVITSNNSCLPEIAGDGALLIDPRSPSEIARAIERLLTSPALRTQLGQAGANRAHQYKWDVGAQQSLAFFRSAL